MRNGKLVCLLKKCSNREFGTLSIEKIGEQQVTWERAITLKEISKKLDRDSSIDIVVIEKAEEKDSAIVNEIANKCGILVLLDSNVLEQRAIRVASMQLACEDIVERISNKEVTTKSVVESNKEENIHRYSASLDSGVEYEQYERLMQERDNWKHVANNAKEELARVKETLDKIIMEPDVAEYLATGEDVAKIRAHIDELEAEVKRLRKSEEMLSEEKHGRKVAEEKLINIENKLTDMRMKAEYEIEAQEILREVINQISLYGREIMEQLSISRGETSLQKSNVDLAQSNVDELRKAVLDLENKLKAAQEIADGNSDLITELRESNEELSIDIKHLESDKLELKRQLGEARDKINAHSKEEESTLDKLSETEMSLAELRAYKIEEMRDTIEQDKQMQAKYVEEIGHLNVEKDALRQENIELKSKVETYKNMAEKARNREIAAERMSNGDTFTPMEIEYVGKAMLLSFVGSGGYGTTSVACAIASALAETASVALVDLDLRSPKMESVLGVDPFITFTLDDSINEEERKTAVGALIKLGGSAWEDMYDELSKNIYNNGRGGRLDYYSGSYATISTTEVSGADYSMLLRKLAAVYDVIVLDLGRLETSGSITNMQAGICNASNKTFIVTNDTFADCRTMSIRLKASKMFMRRSAWVANMCTGRVPKDAEMLMQQAKERYIIGFEKGLYGKLANLYAERSTRRYIDDIVKDLRIDKM